MRNFRLHIKKISIWIVIVLQIVLIIMYLMLQIDKRSPHDTRISFLKMPNITLNNVVKYQTNPSKVFLTYTPTSNLYYDFNSSLCYKIGTDLKQMHGSGLNWNCKCLPGWHGSDCGQPEVIWRALLTYRKPVQIRGRRINQRRIIYILQADDITLINTEIIINELNLVVDLFILYQISTYINAKLSGKILYVKDSDLNSALMAVKSIGNIHSDDIVILGNLNEIPSSVALQFLKLYDKWPQPLQFRYRWNVYGFFWMHPSKTIVKSTATSISHMYEFPNANKPLIVGDLNHFGGWFCQFCYESDKIMKLIVKDPSVLQSNNIEKIDSSYVEDLIENGIYLDGKTELLRARSYLDYYAPGYIVNNSWRYDWLYINLYSKLDYE